MKVAISTDGEFVSAHFGRCPSFTIIDIDNGKLLNRQTIDNPGHQPGFLPQFLRERGVDCIVCGGMGQRAKMLLDQAGIMTIVGVSGSIDEAVSQLLKGTLVGGESLCRSGLGKGYGLDKTSCDHPHEDDCEHDKG